RGFPFAAFLKGLTVARFILRSLVAATILSMTLASTIAQTKSIGSIERLDPAFDKLVPQGAAIEVLGEGFDWAEGCCWIKDKGFLVFSDIPPNKIMKWDPKSGISVFRERVGYTGKEPFVSETPEPGTNGLM